MRKIQLGSTDEQVPVIGQGTWKMGRDAADHAREVDALRLGIERGMTLIDTAEVYSEGGAERVVADAIRDCRDDVFLVTKVSPGNASYEGVLKAADGSLERLQTDRIDLYLLHWPSAEHPIPETMRAMRKLVQDGKVRWVGVSNFSEALMAEAQEALGDIPLVCNQVVYHLQNRVIEKAVLPYCIENQITVMGYSPLGGGNFPEPGSPERDLLDEVGRKYDKTAYQVALNWLVARGHVIAIPKAGTPEHVVANAEAVSFTLSEEDSARIANAFPLPEGDFPLKLR